MCLTNSGSVSSHSLLRSRERETAVASCFPSVRSLPESSINAGADASGPCFPPVMAQKALSMSTSNAGVKPGSWQRFFAYFSQSMERKLASMPNGNLWTVPSCKHRRARKNQRLRPRTQPSRQRPKWREDSSPCGWPGYYSIRSDGNRSQRA